MLPLLPLLVEAKAVEPSGIGGNGIGVAAFSRVGEGCGGTICGGGGAAGAKDGPTAIFASCTETP